MCTTCSGRSSTPTSGRSRVAGWNEAYLLRAFLEHNDAYDVLFWNHYLVRCHTKELVSALPAFHPLDEMAAALPERDYFLGGTLGCADAEVAGRRARTSTGPTIDVPPLGEKAIVVFNHLVQAIPASLREAPLWLTNASVAEWREHSQRVFSFETTLG